MPASDKPVIEYDMTGKSTGKKLTSRWWTIEEDVFEHIFEVIKGIESRQGYKRVRNLRHARLYSNLEIFGLQAGMFSTSANQALVNNRVTYNVVKSCIDTAASKVAKMKPRPMFLTIKGSDDLQKNAKNLTLFMDGAFEAAKLYPTMQRGFTDSGIFGTGETKLVKEGKKIIAERVIADELIVDDVDGLYGEPLTKYQSKFISRFTLVAMFPKHVEKIMSSQVGMAGDAFVGKEFDRVRVIEAWKLPSYLGAKDGRHVICIQNCDLLNEDYKKPYFPFITQRWNYKITGYDGCGLAEELTGIQLEINKLLRTVQVSQHLMCIPRIWIENSSQVNSAHINNEVASIGKYTGTPPVAMTWPGVAPEVYNHIENLVRKAYEITGISQLSAQSKKPAGLDSGVAIREYQDIESERFQLVGQRYEEAHMEAARMMVDMYKDMRLSGVKDIEMHVQDGKFVQKIEWEKLDLDNQQTVMRVFPTSLLPTQPAAKLQRVQELMQAELIDRETGMKLLDFPDIDAAMSLRLAAVENAQDLVSKILEDGEAITPEPYMNLQLLKQVAQNSYLRAQLSNVDESKLELLRQLIENTTSLISQGTPPPQPGPPAGTEAGGQPMALPEAPPVSDLLPNAPNQP